MIVFVTLILNLFIKQTKIISGFLYYELSQFNSFECTLYTLGRLSQDFPRKQLNSTELKVTHHWIQLKFFLSGC